MGIGDWRLWIGDWGLGIGPNYQLTIPHLQHILSKKNKNKFSLNYLIKRNKYYLLNINIMNAKKVFVSFKHFYF